MKLLKLWVYGAIVVPYDGTGHYKFYYTKVMSVLVRHTDFRITGYV